MGRAGRAERIALIQSCVRLARPPSLAFGRWPFKPARRSRRHFRVPDSRALSTEVAIEQNIWRTIPGRAVEHRGWKRKSADGKASSLAKSPQGRKREAWTSAAQNDGSNHDMQPIETARRQEPGQSLGA